MNLLRRPRLGRWKNQALQHSDQHVVIFVHGILSDASTFDELLRLLYSFDQSSVFDFWVFEYNYRQSLRESGDQLADAIKNRAFGTRRVDIVGHSMGGLVARLAVIRNVLPNVRRIVTLATPNHGTISGAQINLLAQMTALSLRRIQPVYARAKGILNLTETHSIMKKELKDMYLRDPTRLDGKSYVSIPAQFYHTKRQLGEPLPSMRMRFLSVARHLINRVSPFGLKLNPVHDGIVEERSNRLHPAPVGSTDEGAFMPRDDAATRILHATHVAADECDHITITASPEVANLIQAVLLADTLDASGIDPFLKGPVGLVRLRPEIP